MPCSAVPHNTGWIWCRIVASRITLTNQLRRESAVPAAPVPSARHCSRRGIRSSCRATAAPRSPSRPSSGCSTTVLPSPCRLEGQHLHRDQIDDAAKGIGRVGGPGPGGDLDRHGIGIQSIGDFLKCALEIGPFAIHLVDEDDPRDTSYRSACRQTVSLCASTPSRALKTTTAPSSTRRQRSTSAVKSTWPGVSSRLMMTSFQGNVTQAE